MTITILYSGGLDSLIMARMAEVQHPGVPVRKLFFDIGQPYAAKERAALPPDVEVRTLDWLTGAQAQSVKDDSHSGDIYIPGRNLVLVALAACQTLPGEIWLGALAGETHAKATDKNWQFVSRTEELLQYVLSPFGGSRIKVRFPLAERSMSKLDAVEWALDNGLTPEQLTATSSCLSGTAGKCGRCVVCLRRWGVFTQIAAERGITFDEQFEVDPPTAPENRAIIREMLYGNYYDFHRKQEILPAVRLWLSERYPGDSYEVAVQLEFGTLFDYLQEKRDERAHKG